MFSSVLFTKVYLKYHSNNYVFFSQIHYKLEVFKCQEPWGTKYTLCTTGIAIPKAAVYNVFGTKSYVNFLGAKSVIYYPKFV